MADYQVLVYSPYGILQKVIDDFIVLDYARRVNTIGACTLTLPPRYSKDDFPRDTRIAITRRVASGGPFHLECETVWFVQTVRWVKQGDGGQALEIVGVDTLDLLRRRIVANASDSVQGNKATPTCADNLCKDIVDENLSSLALEDVMFSGAGLKDLTLAGAYTGGANVLLYIVKIDATGAPDTFKWSDDGGGTWDATGVAITGGNQALNSGVQIHFAATTGHTLNNQWSWFEPSARDWSSHISIQPDLSDGPLVTKQCAWRNVLTTLQELAKASAEAGVYLAFDLVCMFGEKINFRTFTVCRGVDHRYSGAVPVVISENRGQLRDAVLSYDWSGEATYVYEGGQGQGSTRPIAAAYDQARIGRSPFGRIEAWGEVQSTDNTPGGIIPTEARYLLESLRPRVIISGKLQDIPGCLYGLHYGYGDYITAEFMERLDCRLDMIHVTVQGGQETIEVELKSSEE